MFSLIENEGRKPFFKPFTSYTDIHEDIIMLSNSFILELLKEERRTTRELVDFIPPGERKPNDYRVLDRKLRRMAGDGLITYTVDFNTERRRCDQYAVRLWGVKDGEN